MIPRIAELIASQEGYNVPGSIPWTHHNPGDLRHSPHSFHSPMAPDAIGSIPTAEEGWEDLIRQLNLYAARGLTVGQAIYEWAPPSDGNNTTAYLMYIIGGLGCGTDTPLSEAM